MATALRAIHPSQLQKYRLAFGLTGATAIGGAGWLFRDLADLSQWYEWIAHADDYYNIIS